jgi:amino acid transporter
MSASPSAAGGQRISLFGAVSIGIGGMIGAGIFSILGVVAQASGSAMPLAFLIGGFVAWFSTYSYAKLGAKFPSAGGAVEFLVRSFGIGVLSGGINLFMWIGYLISLALYANGFAAYLATFFTTDPTQTMLKAFGVGIVLLFTGVNLLGAGSVGRWESIIVAIKLGFLVLFAIGGLMFIDPERLAVSTWPPFESVLFGAGVLFIGYEGFGLVTNAAGNMNDPQRMLPKALYISVFAVAAIYVAVSVAVIGNLTIEQIAAARDHALAEAAKPFLGQLGFKLIAIAALFSTASAINATLFGASNDATLVAQDLELPASLGKRRFLQGTNGLLWTAGIVVVFILLFDLASVAMMGSAAFLLIYAAVNAGHLRIASQTGAKPWLLVAAVAVCLAMFVVLSIYIARVAPQALVAMAILVPACFLAEAGFRRWAARS